MSDYLGMKKVCAIWILKIFTPLQHASRIDLYEELLESCKQDPTGFFRGIVTEDQDMDTPLRSTQPTRSKDLEGTRRKGINLTTSHTIG